MTELHPANNDPLQQKAKELLRQIGGSPDPDALYATQLMRRALDKGLVELRPGLRGQISYQVDLLKGMDPQKAQRWLTIGQEETLLPSLPDDPEDAVEDLLNAVHRRLQDTVDGYETR